MWGEFAFCTVTAHEKVRTPGKTYKTLQSALSKLFKRMRRANAYSDMPYVRVYEPHADGRLHVHMIIHWTSAIGASDERNERWLKDNMRACGGGYIADYQTIEPAYDPDRDNGRFTQSVLQVASYVLKYMSKGVQETVKAEGYPRMRVIQASQDFPPELATDVEAREWRVQDRYRYGDYVKDVKPVRDVQIGKRIRATDFDAQFDNIYPDSHLFDAHLTQAKH